MIQGEFIARTMYAMRDIKNQVKHSPETISDLCYYFCVKRKEGELDKEKEDLILMSIVVAIGNYLED